MVLVELLVAMSPLSSRRLYIVLSEDLLLYSFANAAYIDVGAIRASNPPHQNEAAPCEAAAL